MYALFAFAIGPIGRYVVAALAFALIFSAWLYQRDRAITREAIQQIKNANEIVHGQADQGGQKAVECPLNRNWNRSTGECKP
jgi:hypothetical protein